MIYVILKAVRMLVVSDGHEAHSRKDVQPFDGPVDDFVEPEQRKDEVGEV